MTEEAIDYQALYESIQSELEQARLTILKMRTARNPLENVNMDKIRKFVTENYLVIFLAVMAIELIIKLLRMKHKE
jgi:heme/copper-type cytochrome/quinol oxidase subunit 1